jgi:hypothetical protein
MLVRPVVRENSRLKKEIDAVSRVQCIGSVFVRVHASTCTMYICIYYICMCLLFCSCAPSLLSPVQEEGGEDEYSCEEH